MAEEKIESEIIPETTPEAIEKLREQDWYKFWAEELRAQIVETEFNVREQVYTLYHQVGKSILEKIEDFTRAEVYGTHVVEIVAEDIKKSVSTVKKARQFAEMFPNLESFINQAEEGKALSWSKITTKYLPKPKEAGAVVLEEEKKEKPHIEWAYVNDKWQIMITKDAIHQIDWSKVKTDLLEELEGN